MPVEASDFAHLPLSEQELILDHIVNASAFLGPLIIASLLDCMLFGLILTESWGYWKWFKDGFKFRGESRKGR